ncbi:unnamed protein product [Microthlaspi erraticum]|uniref:DUF4216 domain-containing protein n=1 Tax=Microthlaspi erraticum TaxID=1685480 RepID=A0A6D2HWJ1_9BRAS|nr:unnamed protein product [Microthlaspi erraticum]
MYYYQVQSASTRDEVIPTWLQELVGGPLSETISWPMYCTRGYVFKRRTQFNNRQTVNDGVYCTRGYVFKRRTQFNNRQTVNDGVVVHTTDVDYYGVLEDILEVEYPGYINLKCVLFKFHWYDPTSKRGVRLTELGVTVINSSRKLNKYDPFIIASQADQVCYLPYPRVSQINNPWITVAQVNPRGRVDGVKDHDPMQQNSAGVTSVIKNSLENTILVDVENQLFDSMDLEGDANVGEFEDSNNSSPSDYSSESE